MDMFSSYDKLDPDHIPQNTSPEINNEYEILDTSPPRDEFNVKGEKVGISWTHGEIFDINLSASTKIYVAENALVFHEPEEIPDNYTEGVKGQQAYNTFLNLSWTCVGKRSDAYIWVQDDNIIYPTNGTKEIYMCPNMSDKSLLLQIYNFRGEEIYRLEKWGVNEITLKVDTYINEILKPSVYRYTLKIIGNESVEVVDDYKIIVK